MNCAIIKETCMDMFISEVDSIVTSESFRDLLAGSPNLVSEIMIELRNECPPDINEWTGRRESRPAWKTYNIHQLQGCMDIGLDYDGTKEMLRSRIAEWLDRIEGRKDDKGSNEDESNNEDESSEQEEED